MSLPILERDRVGDQHEDETERKHERQPQRCEERWVIALMAATTAAIARAPPVSTTSTPAGAEP